MAEMTRSTAIDVVVRIARENATNGIGFGLITGSLLMATIVYRQVIKTMDSISDRHVEIDDIADGDGPLLHGETARLCLGDPDTPSTALAFCLNVAKHTRKPKDAEARLRVETAMALVEDLVLRNAAAFDDAMCPRGPRP